MPINFLLYSNLAWFIKPFPSILFKLAQGRKQIIIVLMKCQTPVEGITE